MRNLALITAILIVGCGPDRGCEGNGPTGPAPVYYSITGPVFDSVPGMAVAGLKVFVGDSLALTSDAGEFMVRQQAGSGFITINDVRFEPLHLPFSFYHPATLTLVSAEPPRTHLNAIFSVTP